MEFGGSDDEKLKKAKESIKKGKSKELKLLSDIMKNIEVYKVKYTKMGQGSQDAYIHLEERYYQHDDYSEITAEVVDELETKLKHSTDEVNHLKKALETARVNFNRVDNECTSYSNEIQAALNVKFG